MVMAHLCPKFSTELKRTQKTDADEMQRKDKHLIQFKIALHNHSQLWVSSQGSASHQEGHWPGMHAGVGGQLEVQGLVLAEGSQANCKGTQKWFGMDRLLQSFNI